MKRPLRVLIVEDEALTVLMLRQFLVAHGCAPPVAVASGQAALDEVARKVPDLILMDVGLAGALDGVETSRRILATHGVPLILMTGYPREEILSRIDPLAITACLTKPISMAELGKHLAALA